MENAVIQEQIAYYAARAQEYDESVHQAGQFATMPSAEEDELAPMLRRVAALGPYDDILELACGTGIWTRELARLGRAVTALDAAPEMLAINQQKLSAASINYTQADLFTWTPERQYDLVFFAFWLSHVPPDRLDGFLDAVQSAVREGGECVIIDQWAATEEDRRAYGHDIYHNRTLHDGRTFQIIKVFYDLGELQTKLAQRHFTTAIERFGEHFFMLFATRMPPSA